MNIALVLLSVFVLSSLALAEFVCVGDPSNTRDISTINDNVVVKAKTSCIISTKTEIRGSIRVESGANLFIRSAAKIRGNVRAQGHSILELGV